MFHFLKLAVFLSIIYGNMQIVIAGLYCWISYCCHFWSLFPSSKHKTSRIFIHSSITFSHSLKEANMKFKVHSAIQKPVLKGFNELKIWIRRHTISQWYWIIIYSSFYKKNIFHTFATFSGFIISTMSPKIIAKNLKEMPIVRTSFLRVHSHEENREKNIIHEFKILGKFRFELKTIISK